MPFNKRIVTIEIMETRKVNQMMVVDTYMVNDTVVVAVGNEK